MADGNAQDRLGEKARARTVVAYVAITAILLSIVLPVVLVACGKEDGAMLPGLVLLLLSLILGMISWRTTLGRVTAIMAIVLWACVCVLGGLWWMRK